MFKRLADRVSSAVASVTGSGSVSGSEDNITNSDHDRLTSMGFSNSDAEHALQLSGGNVEQAAEWLLTNATCTTSTSCSVAVIGTTSRTEDDEIQKAIAASLEDATSSTSHDPSYTSNPLRPSLPLRATVNCNPQSAASQRAGEAALERFDKMKDSTKKKQPNASVNRPVQSHPNVKVPKPLAQHNKEAVILRCAQRIAPYSVAVDTLRKSLVQLQQNPTNLKYRTIDVSTTGFKRSLDVPGTLDFLEAMGYRRSYGNRDILELSFVDLAALYLGTSALEKIQEESEEYKQNKADVVFDQEINQILTLADQDMQEALARSQFMTKLPSEPVTGGGQIIVQLGSTNRIQRKFDGDDCLQDILNWLGAHGSLIPVKLEQKKWYLVNRNHSESVPYNITDLKERTLQYIGCWPSARLAVVPLSPTNTGKIPASSRGLGAAPMDILQL